MKPRCAKILPKLQEPCNKPAGHTGRCKRIDRAKLAACDAAWAAANPERKAATNAAWCAAHPGRWGAANPEHRAAVTAAWAAANPERKATTNAAWAKANPERVKAKIHKRRAVKAGATTVPYTPVEYKARMVVFGDACYYCALLGIVGPHECDDHVFPLQPRKGHKPGPHALRNLVPSCTRHNTQKSNKQPIDFINKLLAT